MFAIWAGASELAVSGDGGTAEWTRIGIELSIDDKIQRRP
jgi:hypothetical protein